MESTRRLHDLGQSLWLDNIPRELLGVERFGASAPAEVLLREYGWTVDNVCARAKALLRV